MKRSLPQRSVTGPVWNPPELFPLPPGLSFAVTPRWVQPQENKEFKLFLATFPVPGTEPVTE